MNNVMVWYMSLDYNGRVAVGTAVLLAGVIITGYGITLLIEAVLYRNVPYGEEENGEVVRRGEQATGRTDIQEQPGRSDG